MPTVIYHGNHLRQISRAYLNTPSLFHRAGPLKEAANRDVVLPARADASVSFMIIHVAEDVISVIINTANVPVKTMFHLLPNHQPNKS